MTVVVFQKLDLGLEHLFCLLVDSSINRYYGWFCKYSPEFELVHSKIKTRARTKFRKSNIHSNSRVVNQARTWKLFDADVVEGRQQIGSHVTYFNRTRSDNVSGIARSDVRSSG